VSEKKESASVDSTEKSRWIWHIVRHEGLLMTILQGCTVDKNQQRRKWSEMSNEPMGRNRGWQRTDWDGKEVPNLLN